MKVIGFKKVDFVTPEKQSIKGIKVFVTYADPKDKNLNGSACESIFITEAKAGDWTPVVGKDIDVVYNKYGKVERIIPAA
ncbi:MAG: hypothetical protein AAGU75_13355 [Bacillota bacterium]